jgi:hypothetical protein
MLWYEKQNKWIDKYMRCSNALQAIFSCKIKVKFTLEQATKDQRGSRGIALLFP